MFDICANIPTCLAHASSFCRVLVIFSLVRMDTVVYHCQCHVPAEEAVMETTTEDAVRY